MHAKTRLEMLRSLKRRKALAKGFTLVELMIVVAILGILAAVALPRFLGARDAAAGGAAIGEKTALAKECATWIASGFVGNQPTTGGTCGQSSGSYVATWPNAVSGLRCLGLTLGNVATATITVGADGSMTCG